MRLPEQYGTYINRQREISFFFDGKRIQGYEGDTIASALVANDIKILSRSFKYHRPRGILSMAGQDSNTLVQIGSQPNLHADVTPIQEGLHVLPQNTFGSLTNDWGRVIDKLGRFLPVGFYYHAFFKPKGAWKYWEPLIRKMAGLGTIDQDAIQVSTDKLYKFADVVVIGGGPAGLQAAFSASKAGAEVLLIEDNVRLGGALNYSRCQIVHDKKTTLLNTLVNNVESNQAIEVLLDAKCTGWFSDNWLCVISKNRLYKIRAKSVVLASGVIEQPAVFRNNDLPGIYLGSAVQRLIHLYGVKPGNQAVVIAGNEDAYDVALDLLDAGITIQAIVELRTKNTQQAKSKDPRLKDIKTYFNHAIDEAIENSRTNTIKAVSIKPITDDETKDTKKIRIDCDMLCVSVGYSPAAQLICHFGGQLVYNEDESILKIENTSSDNNSPKYCIAGSVNGYNNLDNVCQDGLRAGKYAAIEAGCSTEPKEFTIESHENISSNYPWPIFKHPKGKEFVDFDEDLQIKDIQNAVADGFDDLELVKRYSTVVMGPSQGRQSALNNLRIANKAMGHSLHGAQLTTQRPPFYSEKIQLLAGKGFNPIQRTAMHSIHLDSQATMMPAGNWYRPAFYGDRSDSQSNIQREVMSIRKNVGLIDVSTLGKIDIQGPDAAEFVHRMYTFNYLKQPIDKCRYVLMVDGDGVITDDGVAARFHDQHFYLTTTTIGVDSVYRSMLFWNTQWHLDVVLSNVTSAYAAMNVAGPHSREVLSSIINDVDLSREQFGFSGARVGHIEDIPIYMLRVGFVGELGYELHVPSSYAQYIWHLLIEAGQQYDLRPVGVEAQRMLRLEKGHIIVGQDTDGLTHPYEVNMDWAVGKNKDNFIGQRSLEILKQKPLSRILVGFEILETNTVPEECNLTLLENEIMGRITSVAHSPTLEKIIGLAYVHPNCGTPGDTFNIKYSDGTQVQAKTVSLPFYDAENTRQEL